MSNTLSFVFAIVRSSFQLLSAARVYPRGDGWKRRAAAAAAGVAALPLVAGCGGGDKTSEQSVTGRGFAFSAPAEWTVEQTVDATTVTPTAKAATLVSVAVLPLRRRYRPSLWPRVVPELDRVAGALAAELRGSVDASRTVDVAAARARQYEISFTRRGERLRERITFVLHGRREYQLLCRWKTAGDEPEACALLVASFRLR